MLDEALDFARTLNNRADDVAKINGGTHPDLFVASPDGSSIKIDAIRDLTRFTRYGPSYAPWKIVIVDRADRLTEEAANAFLKTLEEPVPGVLFILTTSRENKILRTIFSRCQRLYFDEAEASGDAQIEELAEKLLAAGGSDLVSLFKLSDELASLDDPAGSLSSAVTAMRATMGKIPDGRAMVSLRSVFRALRALELHGNRRLTIDNMLLSFKEAYSN